MQRIITSFLLIIIYLSSNGQVNFECDLQKPAKGISNDLIGVFFEDINYAADGGLYAEMVQNRSFEYFEVPKYVSLKPLDAWSLIKTGDANASMMVENTKPINANNKNYLKLTINNAGNGAGIRNSGFDGMVINYNKDYNFSVYIRSESPFSEPVIVSLQNEKGNAIGESAINNITSDWKKYNLTIRATSASDSAKLVLMTKGKGTLYFDMVSLFPAETFKNRPNGLRADLAQTIADLKPRFLRFPGGCISHGRGIENAYRWKATIGDITERKANWNTWGYHQTYGLGFFEYFQFCEDIGAIALPVLPVGVSCQFRDREIVPLNEMKPWIDDALDLVEFANGDVNTTWGKKRADMGHPQPFNIQYICLGNEEDDIPEFRERFKMIADALKAKYPEIKILGTSGTIGWGDYYNSLWDFSRQEKLYAVDEHYYVDPSWLLANNHRYDNFDRTGPKVFIGEYASWDDRTNNAIAEAAYLTGVERNGDIIQFTCYAPLLCNENHNQWNPDLIRFNNKKVVKTANYYVQQLYSLYNGDQFLNSSITPDPGFDPFEHIFNGRLGVGSWKTQVQFDKVSLVCNNSVEFSTDFSLKPENWEVLHGTFSVSGDVYAQTSDAEPALSLIKKRITESEYTYSLEAKKTGGAEGFLIPFGFNNDDDFYWLNLGGWNNSKHAVEKSNGKGKALICSVAGTIKTDEWYQIKIVVNKSEAKIFLNNELLFSIPAPSEPVTASVVMNTKTNELIIKLVNSAPTNIDVNLNLKGLPINQKARLITLSGKPNDRNSIANPELIKPIDSYFKISNRFKYNLTANSVSVFVIPLTNQQN